MSKRHSHRRGSLAFKPRKRAISQMPSINFWPNSTEKRLLGFAGYKAGMTHIAFIEDGNSPNKGVEVSSPVTIIEVPPMCVYGVRGYKAGNVLADVLCSDMKLLAPLGIKKLTSSDSSVLTSATPDSIFVLVYAQPQKTGIGKKCVERMEIAVGGKDSKEALEYALTLLGKEVKASEVFKPGEYVDTVSVTIGKGWQGVVKRHGVHKQRRKATGKVRHAGTLGAWHPGYVQYSVPMAGQMGYHHRTELNKRVMKTGAGAEINPKGGFLHYGIISNEYVMLAGSVGGPVKRLIRMRKAVRMSAAPKVPDIKYVSTDSKQ